MKCTGSGANVSKCYLRDTKRQVPDYMLYSMPSTPFVPAPEKATRKEKSMNKSVQGPSRKAVPVTTARPKSSRADFPVACSIALRPRHCGTVAVNGGGMGVAPLRIHTVTLLARNGVINLFFFWSLLASSAISFLSVSFLSSVGFCRGAVLRSQFNALSSQCHAPRIV